MYIGCLNIFYLGLFRPVSLSFAGKLVKDSLVVLMREGEGNLAAFPAQI